jgi:hypothetical protein
MNLPVVLAGLWLKIWFWRIEMFKFTKCLVGVSLQIAGMAAFAAFFATMTIAGNIEGRLRGDKQPKLDI